MFNILIKAISSRSTISVQLLSAVAYNAVSLFYYNIRHTETRELYLCETNVKKVIYYTTDVAMIITTYKDSDTVILVSFEFIDYLA